MLLGRPKRGLTLGKRLSLSAGTTRCEQQIAGKRSLQLADRGRGRVKLMGTETIIGHAKVGSPAIPLRMELFEQKMNHDRPRERIPVGCHVRLLLSQLRPGRVEIWAGNTHHRTAGGPFPSSLLELFRREV